MGNLFFPQLSSGAMAQYPIRKQRLLQSPLNVLADGSLIGTNLNLNSRTLWHLAYTELTAADQTTLANFATATQGALLPFTFIDPLENMLNCSTNLQAPVWQADPLLTFQANQPDPANGSNGLLITNNAGAMQQLTQSLPVSASFQYCFSVYARANNPTSIALSAIADVTQSQSFGITLDWLRLVYSFQLPASQNNLTISLQIPAAQSVVFFGPQLEPQAMPSRYRPTAANGGVYQNAHLAGNSLTFEAEAPGLFSTLFIVETT